MIASGASSYPAREPFTLAQSGKSKLGVKSDCSDRHWAAIAVVARVIDELGIDAAVKHLCKRNIIISFENLLWPRMRQAAVTNENSEPAEGEIALVSRRNVVGEGSNGSGAALPPGAPDTARLIGSALEGEARG